MASSTEPPAEFVCPISQQVMTLPVVAPDGYVYEHHCLMQWLALNPVSPMTRRPMDAAQVSVDRELLRRIMASPFRHAVVDLTAPEAPEFVDLTQEE